MLFVHGRLSLTLPSSSFRCVDYVQRYALPEHIGSLRNGKNDNDDDDDNGFSSDSGNSLMNSDDDDDDIQMDS